MELSGTRLKFVCPGCGGAECTSTAEGVAQVLDFPVACSACGARARLKGARAWVAATLGVVAVLFLFYFTVVVALFKRSEVLGYLGLGAMALAFYGAERFLRRLVKWELGQSTRGPDETSLSRALRTSWPWLLPAALFGPCVAALGGFAALPKPVIALLFFGALGAAVVPIVSGRAPVAFWFVAVPLWFCGAAAALALA